MLIGWGEGLNLAGDYLDAKPDAADLTVTSWYGNGPFSFYFSGQYPPHHRQIQTWGVSTCVTSRTRTTWWSTPTSGSGRTTCRCCRCWTNCEPEHTVWLHGLEMARIYAVADIPPEQIEWLAQTTD